MLLNFKTETNPCGPGSGERPPHVCFFHTPLKDFVSESQHFSVLSLSSQSVHSPTRTVSVTHSPPFWYPEGSPEKGAIWHVPEDIWPKAALSPCAGPCVSPYVSMHKGLAVRKSGDTLVPSTQASVLCNPTSGLISSQWSDEQLDLAAKSSINCEAHVF